MPDKLHISPELANDILVYLGECKLKDVFNLFTRARQEFAESHAENERAKAEAAAKDD